eukprot:CAMPEP_0201647576 /NCGR_PEP_ID=MMETSP0493-20130528/36059_1 /ASSEMBLY_ACC=CAM_ASM_000838 /TAXON_ID=420259 /ORGANISM="Thalassiosira gravida, Strain GMp14c1" /LENGTH=55 /DNA_ID=CAMNT_0048123013 /DNA_START=37 /DNA_END=200 /DNA_ORIENTATION=-
MPRVENNAAGKSYPDGKSELPQAAAKSVIAERCRNEVHIAEDSKSWTCGATCGTG